MRKTICILAILFCASYLYAQDDFTMDFDSTIGFNAYQYDYPQLFENTLDNTAQIYPDYSREKQIIIDIFLDTILYARHSIGADASMYYSLGGLIGYNRINELYGHLSEFIIELAFGENSETKFNLKIGRQPFADPTAYLINQSLDGIIASLQSGIVQANIGIGYSGLFPGNQSNIILSPDDRNNFRNVAWGSAAQRLIFTGDVTFDLIPEVQLGAHLGLQIDAREASADGYGITSWYIGAHNFGEVVPDILNYTAQIDLSVSHFTNRAEPAAGFFINNHWTFIFPTESRGSMSVGFDLSTENFRTISNIKQGYYFLGDLDSLFALSWRFDWQPFSATEEYWLKSFNIFLQGKHFVNTTDSSPRGGILTIDSTQVYGHEITFGFDLFPLSDIGIEAFLGGFLGDATGTGQFFSSIFLYYKF